MRLKSFTIIVTVLSVVFLLSACKSGSSKEVTECKEIAKKLQNDLSSKTIDKDIQLKFYYLEEVDSQFFLEEYHTKLDTIDYGIVDRKTQKIDWQNSANQTTQDLKDKYMDDKNLIYETTIDYANKED